MIPELGHFALVLAFALAVVQSVVPLAGVARGYTSWMGIAIPAARAQFCCVALAFAALAWCFYSNDFSVAYVAQNSNTQLPTPYRLSAVWGAHEGSLLLWVLILGVWTFAVSRFNEGLPADITATVISVMGLVSSAFLLFLLLTSNPFLRLATPPADGADLNPLLQDPGLVVHPPILYTGYVGFSVAFAFALAALIRGRLTTQWARWVRPWTVMAWVFLTLGIALGSWWAYYELGWGGWWFWDPVENASFMPWLLGTALIHSLAVTEKRGTFKNWTVLLAIGTFALSLLGTFLVRSGVLTSVHAFATDPARGIFVLAILGVAIGGSLSLFAWRGPQALAGAAYGAVSRETFLLANSLLLAVATSTVLLGTLYPLVLDALGLGKISVGPPYFDLMFSLVMAPLVLLLGYGQFSRWKSDSLRRLGGELKYALSGCVTVGFLCLAMLKPEHRYQAGLGLAFAFWILASTAVGLWQRIAPRGRGRLRSSLLSRAFLGQCIAHAGFALSIIGIVLTSYETIDLHTRMAPGETKRVGPYDFQFVSLREYDGPNFHATEGRFRITRDGAFVAELTPEKRNYTVRAMPMTEAGIAPGLTRDLYISMGEPLGGGAWSMRLHYKAFVRFIWLGALVMALGGVIAIGDRRFRLATRTAAERAASQA